MKIAWGSFDGSYPKGTEYNNLGLSLMIERDDFTKWTGCENIFEANLLKRSGTVTGW